MKIIYRGGYNKRDPESVRISTIPEYNPVIKKLHSSGKFVAVVTLAKPDKYYAELLAPLINEIDIIDTTNVENTIWAKYSLVILMGGNTPTLQKWLELGQFSLKKLKKEAVIVGDSAGALVLCPYYYDGKPGDTNLVWHSGLNSDGKLAIIVHANNPWYAPLTLFPVVEKFAKEKGLKVIKINENQSFLLNGIVISEIKPEQLPAIWDQ